MSVAYRVNNMVDAHLTKKMQQNHTRTIRNELNLPAFFL